MTNEEALRLLDISFENGKRSAAAGIETARSEAFGAGFDAGYKRGVEDTQCRNHKINELIELGRELFGGF